MKVPEVVYFCYVEELGKESQLKICTYLATKQKKQLSVQISVTSQFVSSCS